MAMGVNITCSCQRWAALPIWLFVSFLHCEINGFIKIRTDDAGSGEAEVIWFFGWIEINGFINIRTDDAGSGKAEVICLFGWMVS